MSAGAKQARDVGILVWGTVLGKLAEAVGPIVIARLLGKAEYGSFGALMLVYATFTIVLTAGLPKVVLLCFADASPGQRRTLFRRVLGVSFGLAIADALCLLALATFGLEALARVGGWIGGEGSATGVGALDGLGWMALYAVFDLPTRNWSSVALAQGRPREAAFSGFFRSVGMVSATAIPAALGHGVPGIVTGLLVFGALHLLVFVVVSGRGLGRGPSTPTPWTVARIARYAALLGATEAVSVLNAQLDQWIVLVFFSLEAVAEYRNGAWQIPVVTTIAYSVASVQLPGWSRDFAEGRGRAALRSWREAAMKSARIVVPLSLVFVAGARDLMVLAFGPEYAASGPVFACYAWLTLARITAFGPFLVAARRPGDLLRAASWTLLSNALISVPLAAWLGFIGPAIGTLIAFVPTVWIYARMMARAADAPLRDTFPLTDFLRVLAFALPGWGLAVGLDHFLELGHLGRLGLFATLIPAAYLLGARLGGLVSAEDLAFVRGWVGMRVFRSSEARELHEEKPSS